jgi:hypothetical protein
MPNIHTACQQGLDALQAEDYEQGKAVFACFLNYVKENDVDGQVQAGVAKYLWESVDEEYVIATSCTIEAMADDGSFDEAAISACNECWPWANSLSPEGLPRARECMAAHMPNIGAACREDTELLVPGDEEQGRKVLRCFYDFVLDNDVDEVVQTGVRDYLDNNK